MNNFNRQQILYCTYCGRECNNLNSLKQHECRCKLNPNHIKCKGGINNHTTKTKGYKWINNGYKQLYLPSNKINNYLLNGWKLGMNNVSKQNISKSLLGKSKGIASTIEKELERKQKISNSLKGNTNWMFNKHHGNAKQGWYKGIHCDSTWELAYLVYHIEHNLLKHYHCYSSYLD